MARHNRITSHHHNLVGIKTRAHNLVGPFAGHRVTVARHPHQARAAHPRRRLYIAIERFWHRHQVITLDFQHVCNRQLGVIGVRRFRPYRSAAVRKPRVQLDKCAKPLLTCLDPNPPAAVLNILLNDAFLPPRGDVAEISIKQVMAAHGLKASVDHALFAFLDLVDSGLHVVIDPATSHATQRRKRPRMGIK